jgi:hypothetical protein
MNDPIWPEEPFTRSDLDALQATESDLRRAQRTGEIRTLLRGVFVAAHATDTLQLRADAVAKVVRPHHVLADRTAAWLHGVDAHVFAEHDVLPPIETCALRGHEPSTLPGVDGRTRDLMPEDVMVLNGMCVTTPLRTALDLGCGLRRREAYAVLNAIARRHGLSRDDYLRAVPRYRRRRGVLQLRELTLLVDPRIESERESWVFLAICDAGLPLPEPQFWIDVDGVPTFRLDFAYPRLRICVEYDGVEGHERTRSTTRYGAGGFASTAGSSSSSATATSAERRSTLGSPSFVECSFRRTPTGGGDRSPDSTVRSHD